jgi:hypothetical protein
MLHIRFAHLLQTACSDHLANSQKAGTCVLGSVFYLGLSGFIEIFNCPHSLVYHF